MAQYETRWVQVSMCSSGMRHVLESILERGAVGSRCPSVWLVVADRSNGLDGPKLNVEELSCDA
jgi:hypothetical protein